MSQSWYRTKAGATLLLACLLGSSKFALALPFAYVANQASNNVSAYAIDAATGALTAVTGSPFSAGSQPVSVSVTPNGAFAYVVNLSSANVSAYSINASTGALTPVAGSPFPAALAPGYAAVTPNGAYLYVSNSGSDSISAYRIDAGTGALAPVAGSPFAAAFDPFGVAVTPNGSFLYATNSFGNVSGYSINPATGALAPVAGSPFSGGSFPLSVAVSPNGAFAYVADTASVLAYAIGGAGALTPVAGSPFTAGSFPKSVVVTPNGGFAYVTNSLSSNVSGFSINSATGALTPLAGSPFAAGAGAESVAVTANGAFAYVANVTANGISAYRIDAGTGALTVLAGSPFAVGTNPKFIVTTNTVTADLALAKTGPATVVAGDTISYTVTVTNNGVSDAQNVLLTDPLPVGTTFVSLLQSTGPAFSSTTPAVGGTGTVTSSITTLAAGASASFTLLVLADIATPGETVIANTASVASATGDPIPANNSATVNTTVSPGPADLSIVKIAAVSEAFVGTPVTYTLNISNAGPAPATNVVVTDVLPPGTGFGSATPSQGACGGTTTLTCALGTIASGGFASINMTVFLPGAVGMVTNSASVSAANPDPVPGNNVDAVSVSVVPRPAIPAVTSLGLTLLALLLGLIGAAERRMSQRRGAMPRR